MVYLKCDAKSEDAGPRIIITQVRPLEEMAAQSSSDRLEITLDDMEPLARVQSLLGIPQDRGCKVILFAPAHAARLAEVHVPGTYRITPESLLEMQSLPGVRQVTEG